MNDINGNDLVETAVRPLPWADFRKEVMTHYEPPLVVAQTRRAMIRMFDFVGTLEPPPRSSYDLTISLITRVLAAREGREESPRTKIALLRCISCAATIAVQSGYLTRSPFALRPIKRWIQAGKPQGRRHLSRLELGTLLGSMKRDVDQAPIGWKRWKTQRIYTMAAVAAYSGVRAGELEWLDVADIDLERRIIAVRPKRRHRLKTVQSEDMVPMPRALVPIVREWLEARLAPPTFPPSEEVPWLFPGAKGIGPWTGGPPGAKHRDVLQAAGIAAGIGHVTWQMLRRSLATHLRAAGVSGAMASRILRHSEAVAEAYYVQDDKDNLRDAVQDVEF